MAVKTIDNRIRRYLPVTCLTSEAASRDGLMAATIRHNRARGRHQIHAMSEIVRELTQLGWTPQKIGKELGMDADEVLRLKQISGLTEMFAGRQFSQAWTIKCCAQAGWKSCPVKGPISCWRTTAPSPILTMSASAAG